jgi:hypothetical protein
VSAAGRRPPKTLYKPITQNSNVSLEAVEPFQELNGIIQATDPRFVSFRQMAKLCGRERFFTSKAWWNTHKNQNGLPLEGDRPPVNCWDWTKAIALPRVPLRLTESSGLLGAGARVASGLSHLMYKTTGTIRFHQLDQPPFPCRHNLQENLRRVNGCLCGKVDRTTNYEANFHHGQFEPEF